MQDLYKIAKKAEQDLGRGKFDIDSSGFNLIDNIN